MPQNARPIQRNKGFTVLEALTAAIIISVLVMIVMPNFIRSKDHAYEASMETNARTLRVMLETYKVDHNLYPEDLRTLGREASTKRYNKEVANPITGVNGVVESGKWAIDYVGTSGPSGTVAYQPLAANSKYYLFIYDTKGNLLRRKGQVFTMTNG